MYLRKAALLAFACTLFVSGCGALSEDEKKRIEDAEDNLEKVALAPQITKPSADESISGNVEVYVDVDSDSISNYESVTLFIEGEPDLVDLEFPYRFNFNAYYWSTNQKISLMAKVKTLTGTELRSEVVSVPVASSAASAMAISSPQNHSILHSVNEVSVSWTALDSAVSYEYQINEAGIVSTEQVSALVSLPALGQYSVKVRATNAEGRTGAWSTDIGFSLQQPQTTQISAPLNGQSFQNINQVKLQWAAMESAAYYEYQLNSGDVVRADDNQAAISISALGSYQLKVRSIDHLGYISDWTDTVNFELVAPNSPTISSTSVSETDAAFLLTVETENGLNTNDIQIATQSSFAEDSIVSSQITETAELELAAGIYYVRARTHNEFEHVSDWSNVEEVSVGLFAHAMDMNPGAWEAPFDFVIDEDSFVVAASMGPLPNGTDDTFYVTKIDKGGAKDWGLSVMAVQANSLRSIRKTDTGYLLAGRQLSLDHSYYHNAVILEINNDGQLIWLDSMLAEAVLLENDDINVTKPTFHDAIEVADDQYAILATFEDWTRSGSSMNSNNESVSKIIYLDRRGDTPVKTEHIIEQPESGKYQNFTNLLLKGDSLYAVGAYQEPNVAGGTGAVALIEIDKTDGSIKPENTRTASGLADRNEGDVVQDSGGDIYVSCEYCSTWGVAASIFHSTGQSTANLSQFNMKRVKLSSDSNNNVYMAGTSTSSNTPASVVRFNTATEQARVILSKYSNELQIKSIKYHDKYGLVVLAEDHNHFAGLGDYDYYTVIFNITDSMQYIAPTKLMTDHAN